ncbi:hypothetical protein FP74_gp013 [Bacillus phage CAM003]|uniref:Uncharacterized protein n=1 Tax=Bacillus phage CAM003 TaxID=1486657 RepID=A0A024AZ45_9CAUD|nr:hypothetical protein FP74_gp013 [Bacillus phage CAM003]AHZ09450.1 hypothetical protein [Bacillus phage CAM003]
MIISDELKRDIYDVANAYREARNNAEETFFEIEGELDDELSQELIKAWEDHIESGDNNPEVFIDMLRKYKEED